MDLIVVGAGWAGEHHVLAAQALQRTGVDTQVAALVDVDREHLAQKAAEWGISATYPDLPTALSAHPDAMGIVLATPHHLHRQGTEQAADAGRHVLVEKPMALTLEDADAMIDACRRAGTTLMVAESTRYQKSTIAVRDAIQAGKIGQLLSGRMNMIFRGRHTYAYPGRRAWLADPTGGGSGIWMLNGIHGMSAVRLFLGEVTRIYARQVKSDAFQSEPEATVVALISFDSGAELTMTVSAELHGYGRFGDLVLFGSEGTLELCCHAGSELRIYTDREPKIVPCDEPPTDNAEPHFVRQMQEFLDAVAQAREPFTSGASERESLAAILAGYESIQTGQPVVLKP
ncbi:MAG TPA: Gfo/Idh/MocA family oxidoreductase [Phycisphaerae bacterium]|nr:Gfo/Idh/MocA family oxidoreductase [Phycisphaerae bacterium]